MCRKVDRYSSLLLLLRNLLKIKKKKDLKQNGAPATMRLTQHRRNADVGGLEQMKQL